MPPSTPSATSIARPDTAPDASAQRWYSVLIGLAALAVLLQGLWAGIFLQHDGERDAAAKWIDVHARGGEIAIVLTLAATAHAAWKLRSHRELIIGGVALAALLALEAYLGGLIVDQSKDSLTAVHVPLGMAIMALAIWLPVRARHNRRLAVAPDASAGQRERSEARA